MVIGLSQQHPGIKVHLIFLFREYPGHFISFLHRVQPGMQSLYHLTHVTRVNKASFLLSFTYICLLSMSRGLVLEPISTVANEIDTPYHLVLSYPPLQLLTPLPHLLGISGAAT
jgi:hypothetical protein